MLLGTNETGLYIFKGEHSIVLSVSNEVLSAASRFSDRPILSVLSILKNQFWREGEIRAVIVLRNQAARLASGYAQGSLRRWNPGQQDFERVVQPNHSEPEADIQQTRRPIIDLQGCHGIF